MAVDLEQTLSPVDGTDDGGVGAQCGVGILEEGDGAAPEIVGGRDGVQHGAVDEGADVGSEEIGSVVKGGLHGMAA